MNVWNIERYRVKRVVYISGECMLSVELCVLNSRL